MAALLVQALLVEVCRLCCMLPARLTWLQYLGIPSSNRYNQTGCSLIPDRNLLQLLIPISFVLLHEQAGTPACPPLCSDFASPVPCRLCLLLIYNAYPDHDKVQNWERRCGCVAHLCGCYKTMTSKVEDRSVQWELLLLWQEQRVVPATCGTQQMGCQAVASASLYLLRLPAVFHLLQRRLCPCFMCEAVIQSLKDQQPHNTKKSTSLSLSSTA